MIARKFHQHSCYGKCISNYFSDVRLLRMSLTKYAIFHFICCSISTNTDSYMLPQIYIASIVRGLHLTNLILHVLFCSNTTSVNTRKCNKRWDINSSLPSESVAFFHHQWWTIITLHDAILKPVGKLRCLVWVHYVYTI